MGLIVQKYGGSSVGSLERIQNVADRIIATRNQGHQLVVVVSAMYGETDRLIQLANALTSMQAPREYDLLISSGEQVATSLLSIALNAKGQPARAFTGIQLGIYTNDIHTNARIKSVSTTVLQRELDAQNIVVVAGFQGVNSCGDVTTLGRGGSDTTAVAIAIALGATECQIYTDVAGVYTTDPHLLPEARLISIISFTEMLEMSCQGAKVLQIRSVELAQQHKMPIRVLSSFSDGAGTLVTCDEQVTIRQVITGLAFSREEAVIVLTNAALYPQLIEEIYSQLKLTEINIDILKPFAGETNDFTFSLHRRDFSKTCKIIEELILSFTEIKLQANLKLAKLSLIGLELNSHPELSFSVFKTLVAAGIAVQMIAQSTIKLSIMINDTELEAAVRIIHHAFELDQLYHQDFVLPHAVRLAPIRDAVRAPQGK